MGLTQRRGHRNGRLYQHDFSQDLAEIQNVNREWQDFSGQVANFDDTLNNQQLVQDPSTGTLYEAPYSSYEQNGPRGLRLLPAGRLFRPTWAAAQPGRTPVMPNQLGLSQRH